MKKFVLCYPSNFGVSYEINEWMNGKIGTVNQEIALEQWENFYRTLKSINPDIEVIQSQPVGVPDLVFTANAAMIHNGKALLANFKNPERKNESLIYGDFLTKLGLSVDNSCIKEAIDFEGAGDILFHKKTNTYVLACGFRTDEKASDLVKKFISDEKVQLLQVKLINPHFYHLDTCFCPLDNGKILYYPSAFEKKSLTALHDLFGEDLIKVSKADAYNFACNAISINQFVIANKFSKKLIKTLLEKGLILVATPLGEFIKAGGSSKCLSLDILN